MYLVTGGGGFIGSHLVRALVQRGTPVRILDNETTGGPWRVADVLDDVEWIHGDVRDSGAVHRACSGVEVVLHHAAVASVPRSIAEPELTYTTNVTGTLNVLQAAHNRGVRRVVLASSAAVYGNLAITPKTETLPTQPVSPYGAHKLAAESYCRVWQQLYGLDTVALRYFNVFGPGQDPQGDYAAVIPRFIAAALAGQSPTIYGTGEQSRDFIYVQNVVDVNLLVAVAPAAAGMVVNVGTGARVTLNQLVAELSRIVGRPIRPIYAPARAGDIHESLADISLLRTTLGYEPQVSFADGLAATVHAFQAEIQPAV